MGTTSENDRQHLLQERLARLEVEMAEIRQLAAAEALGAPAAATGAGRAERPERPGVGTPDRRQLLRRVGAVAAGAVAGGAALAATQANPAAAANGEAFILGDTNDSTLTTTLIGSGSGLAIHSSFNPFLGHATGPNGRGVLGSATGGGVGVVGTATTGAPLQITNDPQTIPPQGGTWAVGQFLVANGHVHWCYAGGEGAQSKWARLSATFVPLAAPVRVYDSRPGAVPAGVVKGKLDNHSERVIDAKLGDAVPAGASAAVINLTATDTNPGGFLSAFKNGIGWPGTSSLNWSLPNTTIANQCTVAVDAVAKFKVRCEGTGGTNFVVDVVGYYL